MIKFGFDQNISIIYTYLCIIVKRLVNTMNIRIFKLVKLIS